jgi:hypothetical protein
LSIANTNSSYKPNVAITISAPTTTAYAIGIRHHQLFL